MDVNEGPFPIVNVITNQSGVASADTAVLQNSRQAEHVRASAAAKLRRTAGSSEEYCERGGAIVKSTAEIGLSGK